MNSGWITHSDCGVALNRSTRRRPLLRKTLIVLLVIVISLMAVGPALAHEEPHQHLCQDVHGDGRINGQDFAEHIVHHAQEGTLGGEHNPGHHRGFSICVIP